MRLDPEQAGRVGEHRPRVRPGEAFAVQQRQEGLRVPPPHVGLGLAVGGREAEVSPTVDHLFGRATAEAELEPPAADEVGSARVLRHGEGVFVAHVDDPGADLDPPGPRADRRQQGEGRGELLGEMVDAEVGAVRSQLLRGDSEVDRLQQNVGGGAGGRAPGVGPVSEGQEADLLHGNSPCMEAQGRR